MTDQIPAVGEMWWLDCDEQWLPVVVLDYVEEDPAGLAVDVVPASTEAEDLDWVDLLLLPGETTTGHQWRLVFRCQSIIDRRKLRERFGALTATGWALTYDAIRGGGIPPERCGPRLESDHDPRLAICDELNALLLPCLRWCWDCAGECEC